MARQTRPLTPAEAVRQGRKMIAERRRQEAERKSAAVEGKSPSSASQADAGAAIGMPISEQDQRVEVVLITPVELGSTPLSEPTKSGAKYSDPIPSVAAMSVFPTSSEAAKRDTHPDGTWPLADLRTGQCRFACTADDVPRDQHRFCGRPTRVGRSNLHGSWCDEHLPRVWGQGSVSERNAHHVTQDVRRFG